MQLWEPRQGTYGHSNPHQLHSYRRSVLCKHHRALKNGSDGVAHGCRCTPDPRRVHVANAGEGVQCQGQHRRVALQEQGLAFGGHDLAEARCDHSGLHNHQGGGRQGAAQGGHLG